VINPKPDNPARRPGDYVRKRFADVAGGPLVRAIPICYEPRAFGEGIQIMTITRTLAFAAIWASALGCGGNPLTTPDPNDGVTFPAGFDVKFQPQTSRTSCPSGACYPVQLGYAHGKPIYFYNLVGPVTASAAGLKTTGLQTCPGVPPQQICKDPQGRLVMSASLVTNHVYEFPTGQCLSGHPYDPVIDAYDTTVQYPVFSQLPLATTSSSAPPVLPIGWVTSVTGVAGDTCNDIKSATSIQNGIFGAASPEVQSDPSVHYSFYAPIDMTAVIPPLTASDGKTPLPSPVGYAWSGDLQTAYFFGGVVPVDGSSNLVAMDGVIVDPLLDPVNKVFSNVTDAKTVILPFAPGESGYSPIVRLHDYNLGAGQQFGDLTDLCPSTGCTAPNQVDMTKAAAASFNTIFIVAVGQ